MARKALPPTAQDVAARAAHRAEGRHAAPAHRPEHAAEGAVSRWFHIVGSKAIFGHAPGTRAELALTDSQANVLMNAGHIAPADAPAAPVAAVAAPAAPEVAEDTGTTPEANNADNSAE